MTAKLLTTEASPHPQSKTLAGFRRAALHAAVSNAVDEKMLALLQAADPENGAHATAVYDALHRIVRQGCAAHRAIETVAKFIEAD